ncbi:MAG: pyridoxine 5'-phosphate synthase, partial [Prevotella sp.]|nr:pyridoxine 5'-phosphate synthase [Prevotella sp.]
ERHIRYSDVRDLKAILTREFNIEGNPIPKFMDLVLKVKPTQVTLVPDSHEQLTSNHGWDTKENKSFLTEVINEFRLQGIRTSVFVDADEEMVSAAAACGADRVELYTGPYAEEFSKNPEEAIKPFLRAAKVAKEVGLGLNAGHDLNLDNLKYFHQTIPWLDEVSIGHAIISDAIYLGLKETIKAYLSCLE